MKINIAIDGPAGSGKSTAARLVAQELGYIHVDTGALYRTVALLGLKMGINYDDAEKLSRIFADSQIDVRSNEQGIPNYFLRGKNITKELRSPKINKLVPQVAKIPAVRSIVTEKLQLLAAHGGVVMDGRDIGTVVLPQAEVKIYLTADLLIRASRRKSELLEQGFEESPASVAEEVRKRDEEDTNRQLAPLRPAPDAHIVDTTVLSPYQMTRTIVDLVEKKIRLIKSGGIQS